ncbi:uncharacterized protein [Ptychodera flava]|uniref:uncharacterized protein n=1 Tax=Ptychodera flava TaxID=63121 RepID=UPI003969F484
MASSMSADAPDQDQEKIWLIKKSNGLTKENDNKETPTKEDQLTHSDETAAAIDERWQNRAFVCFIVGFLIGCVVAGLAFGLYLSNEIAELDERRAVCESHYTFCQHRLNNYVALYGRPNPESDNCHNYVLNNCDIESSTSVSCSNFDITLANGKNCYRGNLNRTIECSSAYVMKTICPKAE